MTIPMWDNGVTALYERLSRDDDSAGESNSILNQKKYLEDYARQNGSRKKESWRLVKMMAGWTVGIVVFKRGFGG